MRWPECSYSGIHHLCVLQSSVVVLISAAPPGMRYFSYFTILLSRDSSSGFHLAFPTVIALTPPVREPVSWFCHLLSMSVTTKHSGTGGKAIGWAQGPTRPTMRQIWANLHWSPDPISPTLIHGAQWCFGSPGISVSLQSLYSIIPIILIISFSLIMVTITKGCISFRGRLGKD